MYLTTYIYAYYTHIQECIAVVFMSHNQFRIVILRILLSEPL